VEGRRRGRRCPVVFSRKVAEGPAYEVTVERTRRMLQGQLDAFPHPCDLAEIPFPRSDAYGGMSERTRSIGTDDIAWAASRSRADRLAAPEGRFGQARLPT
jgi:hypothetical protein